MEALVYDDFSGSGPLEARNTSYKAEHKWVRGQPSVTWQKGLVVESGGATMSAADQALETSDGYVLVASDSGAPIVLHRPFTIVVEFSIANSSGMAHVCTGVSTPGENPAYQWIQAVSVGCRYPILQVGTDTHMPDMQIDAQGSLKPDAAVIGDNRLVVSVNEFGFVVPNANGRSYGFLPGSVYQVPADTNLAIVVGWYASIKSIAVYNGFMVDPPIGPPDPPTPPAVAEYWWQRRVNVDVEPQE